MYTSKYTHSLLKLIKIHLGMLQHSMQYRELDCCCQFLIWSCILWIWPSLNIASSTKAVDYPAHCRTVNSFQQQFWRLDQELLFAISSSNVGHHQMERSCLDWLMPSVLVLSKVTQYNSCSLMCTLYTWIQCACATGTIPAILLFFWISCKPRH